ncbi:alpha/beta fold hydrolase [Gordonia sp. LSe1-13]|uniref:Alpha/beta fold hydrolase n=1 Tax=Gordonia sesuvii TaxID=3116777 RepID=A0ABU7MGY2_9ACTN|nr:alpha/beta fold hydrolase [Gordonia sp. LSe1-13]
MTCTGTANLRAAVIAALVAIAVLSGCRAMPSDGAFDWHSCGPGDGVAPAAIPASVAHRVTCGRLTVELDPDDPDAGMVTLAVARLAAAGSSSGTLVINPGGPGGSGVRALSGSAAVLASQPFSVDHDVVSFDPRGVGASRPAVVCRTDAERDAERAMDLGLRSAAGIAGIESHRRTVADRCRERVGADFLARVGTAYAVSDLEQLRRQLEVDEISYLGYSYGTRLGIEYAQRHPERVRALVLDGVVEPDEDPVDAVVEQMAGFQGAFDAFARDCATRSECPLGDRPDRAVGEYRELVTPLIADPLPVGDRALSVGDAETATIDALYQRSRWAELRAALAALAGGDGSGLMRMADAYEGRDADGGYDHRQDAFLAISCADDRRIDDPERWDELDRRTRAAAPFGDDGRGTGQGPTGLCDYWTPADPLSGDVVGAGLLSAAPTPLVVATTGDPATPYETGADFAREAGADLITVSGHDHTAVFAGDRCVDDAVATYLGDPTESPGDLRC